MFAIRTFAPVTRVASRSTVRKFSAKPPSLSAKTIAVVKSTAPVLAANGETLTRHFYKRMFKNNPEVLPFFNATNQAKGTQPRALAASVVAYAANIDNLGALGPAVELIAHKHASLQVQADQYPIVGSNLLGSIVEVLGDGATKEVIDAWTEAYGFLAHVLIEREKGIYKEQMQLPNGWNGFKKFKVVRKEPESDVITSFYLQPEDGSSVSGFKPGQYITVRVPTPCGHTTMRNYSLSDKPGQPWFRISVKRETSPEGVANQDGYVSNMLHNGVHVGHTVEIGPPCGEFFLPPDAKNETPLVLLSAGVGLTPVMSMLLSALEKTPNRPIFFIHAARNGKTHAFGKQLRELEAKHKNLKVHARYNEASEADRSGKLCDSEGFVDADLIRSLVPNTDGDYFFCGPKPFMCLTYQQLTGMGVPPERIHLEFFGPLEDLKKSS